MKGLKNVRLGLAGILAAALVAVGAFLVVSQVSAAASGTLSISSPAIAAGGSGTADLRSNVTAPGLGAWTVDITYDPAKLTVGACTPAQGGVCNPNFAANMVRITGASANGLIGDTSLGTIAFTNNQAAGTACGAVPLTLTTNVFADATIGDPQSFTPTITNGSVTCAVAATPLPTLGPTGQGYTGTGGESSFGWLILGLGGAGLAALAGFGALRLRSKAA